MVQNRVHFIFVEPDIHIAEVAFVCQADTFDICISPVHIFAAETEDNWSVEVKDTGIGIPASEQKKLFRILEIKFFRIESILSLSSQTFI